MHENVAAVLELVRRTAGEGALAAVIVHLNDTYRIEERRKDERCIAPGFARLAKLIDELRGITLDKCGRDRVLVLHSGDFLSPSLIGQRTKGEHMLAVFRATGVDYLTLGNHEFDYERDAPGNLVRLLTTFKYAPVVSNLSAVGVEPLKYAVWPGSPHAPILAVTGVAGDQTVRVAADAGWKTEDPLTSLEEVIFEIRRAHPAIITLVVLSHMTRVEDHELRKMVDRLWKRGYSFILGGHDHHVDWFERYKNTNVFLFKNKSNLQGLQLIVLTWDLLYVPLLDLTQYWTPFEEVASELSTPYNEIHPEARHRLDVLFHHALERRRRELRGGLVYGADDPSGRKPLQKSVLVAMSREELPLECMRQKLDTEALASLRPALRVETLVERYLGRFRQSDDSTVAIDLASFTDALDASDSQLRTTRTDFGAFIAEACRLGFRADMALINSGSFRIDEQLPPVLTVGDLREIFLYDNPEALTCLELPLAECGALIQHGSLPGRGSFLQLSLAPDLQMTNEHVLESRDGSNTVKVVLVTYMLASQDDGFRTVLGALGRTSEAISVLLEGGVKGSLVQTIVEQAQHAKYRRESQERRDTQDECNETRFYERELQERLEELTEIEESTHTSIEPHFLLYDAGLAHVRDYRGGLVGVPQTIRRSAEALREAIARIAAAAGVAQTRELLDRLREAEFGFRDGKLTSGGKSRYDSLLAGLQQRLCEIESRGDKTDGVDVRE